MADHARLVITEPAEDTPPALGLFLINQISDAMLAVSWDVKKEFAVYEEIATSSEVRPAVRMEAAERMREIARESAILQGYIQKLNLTDERILDGAGNVTHITRMEGGGTFLPDSNETMKKLQAGMALGDTQTQLNAARRAPRLVPPNPDQEPPNADA